MTNIGVFAIFDAKAKAYLQPFFSPNAATAERDFTASLTDPSSGFCRFPADFTLFQVAEWDPYSGSLLPLEAKTPIGNGAELAARSVAQRPALPLFAEER